MQYRLVSAMIGLTHAQTYIRIVSCKADFTWKLSNFQRIISRRMSTFVWHYCLTYFLQSDEIEFCKS